MICLKITSITSLRTPQPESAASMSVASDSSDFSVSSWMFSQGREPMCFIPNTMLVQPDGLTSVDVKDLRQAYCKGFSKFQDLKLATCSDSS
jgi:hypothetical protein